MCHTKFQQVILSSDSASSLLAELTSHLQGIPNSIERTKRFIRIYRDWPRQKQNLKSRVALDLLRTKVLFPSRKSEINFLALSLESHDLSLIKLLQLTTELNVHRAVSRNGIGPAFLMSRYHEMPEHDAWIEEQREIASYFLITARENYSDRHGFTYLHLACQMGYEGTVQHFLAGGLVPDVHTAAVADSTTRLLQGLSPLHLATRHRHVEVVRILLQHGADPRRADRRGSTPLHELAKASSRCRCSRGASYCQRRRPTGPIIKLLLDHGAQLEARDELGRTPLEAAAARFDVELTRELLGRNASLDGLDDAKLFDGAEFTRHELRNYPMALNVIDTVRELRQAGYEMSLRSRFWMIKCLIRVHGRAAGEDQLDYLIPERCADGKICLNVKIYKYLQRELGCYWTREIEASMRKTYEAAERRLAARNEAAPCLSENLVALLEKHAKHARETEVAENLTLADLMRASPREALALLKNRKRIRRQSTMPALSHGHLLILLQRHLGAVLARKRLEWFAEELYMSKRCVSRLERAKCRRLLEKTSDDELWRFCDGIREETLEERCRCDACQMSERLDGLQLEEMECV